MAEVRLAEDASENGLACMMSDLVRQNLEQHPGKGKWLRRLRGTVSIEARDAGVGLTLEFSPGVCLFRNGLDEKAQLLIRASSEDIMALSTLPLRLGLPDLLQAEGRRTTGWILKGRVSIKGLLRHPRLLLALANLVSVSG
jgi:hypothetical protein